MAPRSLDRIGQDIREAEQELASLRAQLAEADRAVLSAKSAAAKAKLRLDALDKELAEAARRER